MPGSIQSIERAAAILRLLAAGPRRLRLAEISASLQLPRGTAHGILRTLGEVGFVEQDRVSGRYHLGAGLLNLGSGYLDVNELRARSMNWADPLAARTGEAVRVGMLVSADVLIVHYVFRPDDSHQSADVGALLPAHASSLGKVLLAYNPGAEALLSAEMAAYTARTVTERNRLAVELAQTRDRGFAVEFGEYSPDQASIAAPIFGYGGLVVAAVAIHGHMDRLCDTTGEARPKMVTQVRDCARAITRELETARSAG
jgi:DNA-binding IclR family transcriptional regulator